MWTQQLRVGRVESRKDDVMMLWWWKSNYNIDVFFDIENDDRLDWMLECDMCQMWHVSTGMMFWRDVNEFLKNWCMINRGEIESWVEESSIALINVWSIEENTSCLSTCAVVEFHWLIKSPRYIYFFGVPKLKVRLLEFPIRRYISDFLEFPIHRYISNDKNSSICAMICLFLFVGFNVVASTPSTVLNICHYCRCDFSW